MDTATAFFQKLPICPTKMSFLKIKKRWRNALTGEKYSSFQLEMYNTITFLDIQYLTAFNITECCPSVVFQGVIVSQTIVCRMLTIDQGRPGMHCDTVFNHHT